MPELIEQMYCSQQIVIPPKFPYILKRYCKAAIKTQPYDLLRWSYEYFNALAQHKPPPVKLRLEYPVYTTEGGLTRGCLKVLAQQLSTMEEVPLPVLKAAWRGFCLDNEELQRILCLCEVFQRKETVPFLHFVAVAAGLLTKTLTHTMVLLCETLTKEPDGGSAAIPVEHFLSMYVLLARMDASKDVKYIDGYREGWLYRFAPESAPESVSEIIKSTESPIEDESSDDFWQDNDLKNISIINDKVPRSARISMKLNMPLIGKLERPPSVERAGQIERENYLRERQDVQAADKQAESKKDGILINVYDEEGEKIPYEIYGQSKVDVTVEEVEEAKSDAENEPETETPNREEEMAKLEEFIAECYAAREERRADLEFTFDELALLVDKFKTANYDLGMVAGRQMSTTSGEFIVQHVEREIMEKVNEQIDILPDPSLKKKKAKPEEVAMVRDILKNFIDDNMDVIVPEEEEVEEEELPIPTIINVYAVPGIGPTVDEHIIKDVEDYAAEVAMVQAELFMPRNIRHFMCPPLEKCIDDVPETPKKEEVPIGGAITD
ncbi:Ropporin-1-like protein [Papilio machaon]|uniref:Ropporin-1-like protein n=1 Tax=Papilio machaon TaxID=76193 RepID=A0A0N1I9V5_PAPMA|nr:Ropporin-1-like protein [Papilio machaon]